MYAYCLSVRAGPSKEHCTCEVRSSKCLAGPKRCGSGDANWSPSSKSITSQRLFILRQRCEATSFHSLQTRQSASLPSKAIAPTTSHLPNNLLACSTCHPASASASPNHFDRPSSAHDKRSSAAIKPQQGPRLSTALPLSPRVSFDDYGRARSGSRRFISGTTYSTPRRISAIFVLARPILSVRQSLTFHSRLKGTSHEMGRRPRRRI